MGPHPPDPAGRHDLRPLLALARGSGSRSASLLPRRGLLSGGLGCVQKRQISADRIQTCADKNTPSTGGEIPPVDGFSLSVASYVVNAKAPRFKRSKQKGPTFVELLTRFEPETSSLPTAIAIFFTYFSVIYSRFCSFLFAFRHSLKTAFPCIPLLSVAGYVVRNPCGTWVSSPEAILFQAKKVVKFESDYLKSSVNSEEISSDGLHLRLQ